MRIDYRLSDHITATSLSSYLTLHVNDNLEYDGTALEAYDLADHTGLIDTLTQEVRLANDGEGGFRWVVGGNFEHTIVDESSLNLSGDSTSAPINGFTQAQFSSSQEMKNYAGFGNLKYTPISPLTLKAGVRYTEADRSTKNCNRQDPNYPEPGKLGVTTFFNDVFESLGFIYPNFKPVAVGQCFAVDNRLGANGLPLNPATYGTAGEFSGTLDEDNVSWSTGLDYKLTPDTLVYANVSRGYKAGSFPDVAAATWSQYDGIRQESITDYELGFKSALANRTITIDGAAFYYNYLNKQLRAKIVDGIFGLLDGLVNVPKSEVYGAELSVAMRPFRGLTIDLSSTFLHAQVLDYDGVVAAATSPVTGLRVPVTQSYAGARLPFSPDWQLSTDFRYEHPISDRYAGFFGADVSAQGKSFSVLAITSEDKSDYVVPDRAIVGAIAGIKPLDSQWELFMWGKNIFNKYYTINTILSRRYADSLHGASRGVRVLSSFKFQ